ncbi:Ferredoxin, 2Fe-2s [Giardia duodenalis]|uniref:Ferredoxin, 2Fe-2s n=1 Tax=Giardia intestinalis TaxID=5741 RepID=V6TUQ2_GIAIN|nr:Ferredoxin, 2Fe-2s [Giardia intestinalis]
MLLYREARVWAFGSALYFQHGSLGPGAADKAMRASSLAGNPIESNSKGPGDAARPAECLICQESDRTQQSANWTLRKAVIPRGASC